MVLLITWVRLPAFIALAAGSFFVGLGSGMPLAEVPRAFQQGVGDTLGFIAMVVGLGTVIGKLLAESGGALVVSRVLVSALGEKRLDWAMLISGFLIGLPVFFQVGLVLLAPVLFTAIRQTGALAAAVGDTARRRVVGCAWARAAAPRRARRDRTPWRGHRPGAVLFADRRLPGGPAGSGPMFGRYISRRIQIAPSAVAEQLSGEVAAPAAPSLTITLSRFSCPCC